ncbi:MAG: hypothetical protein CL609_05235 [Anaerolineaceae bacterium]|nr:hypothetical protein [Anaerolineaceae bacterium]
MLSNLMISEDSHRIDYLNHNLMGSGRAFGVYVRGKKAINQPYSAEVKHRLYASLDYVNRYLNEKELAAIYIDIANHHYNYCAAFFKLVKDIKKGLFNKVLFADLDEIMNEEELATVLYQLADDNENLEIIDLNGNIFQAPKMPINHLLGV